MMLPLEDEQQEPTKICGWCYPLKMSNKDPPKSVDDADFGGSLLLNFKG
jgi:hypothetical protein